MKKILLLVSVLSGSLMADGKPGYDSLSKIATIVHFRIEYYQHGIADSLILEPIHRELMRVFKLNEIIDIEEPPVTWTNGRTAVRKVKPADLEKVNAFAPRTDFLLNIRVEHEYNPILGGLFRGGRHVLRLKCVVFDRQGKRLSIIKKKESCCAILGSSAEDNEDPITAAEFLELYNSIVKRAFGKL